MRQFSNLCLLVIALFSCTQKQQNITSFTNIFDPFPTKDSALIFAPNFISTHLHERDFTTSPNGKEIYYTVMGTDFCYIVYSKLIDGKWTDPQIAPFSGNKNYMDLEPFISKDGKQFFFLSTRAPKTKVQKLGWFYQNIWVMDKTENGWSKAYQLSKTINTENGEYYPCISNTGTLYFTKEYKNGHQYIYSSKKVNGQYNTPQKLPAEINSNTNQFNALIAPDESYLIVCSKIKNNLIGKTDLYISFKNKDETWSSLKNMGPKVNFPNSYTSSPALSKDGKYFFFSSTKQKHSSKTVCLKELQNQAKSPQNGKFDIYWISSEIIDDLREK
jgi:hypothetical protein